MAGSRGSKNREMVADVVYISTRGGGEGTNTGEEAERRPACCKAPRPSYLSLGNEAEMRQEVNLTRPLSRSIHTLESAAVRE